VSVWPLLLDALTKPKANPIFHALRSAQIYATKAADARRAACQLLMLLLLSVHIAVIVKQLDPNASHDVPPREGVV
jgi:hypothetical protein